MKTTARNRGETMRALVVGGTGFLGLNLVEALEDQGHDVSITRRRSSNTILARRMRVPLIPAELGDVDALARAMQGHDTVFMVAGHYPRYSVDTEQQVEEALAGVRNSLEAARRAGVSRYVFTSSAATVGRTNDKRPATEQDGFAAVPEGSTYYAVKIAMEQAVLAEAGNGLDIVVTCPAGCIGPYDYKVGTGFFVVGMATGTLDTFVDGRINIVDSGDVAHGHIQAALHGRPGERYILGGHNLTVRGLLRTMADQLDVAMPQRELAPDEALAFAIEEEARCLREGRGRPALHREMVDMIITGHEVDSTKAKTELGFTARPLAETIDRSYQWYRDNGYIRTPARTAEPSRPDTTATEAPCT